MKTRKHHNNDGRRQIKRGTHKLVIKRLAEELGIEYSVVPPQKISCPSCNGSGLDFTLGQAGTCNKCGGTGRMIEK